MDTPITRITRLINTNKLPEIVSPITNGSKKPTFADALNGIDIIEALLQPTNNLRTSSPTHDEFIRHDEQNA